MEEAEPGRLPTSAKPGPEVQDLRRFHQDVTWTGAIDEGGMGPGSPAMTATGRATHEWIHEGLWVVGRYEQNQYLLDGTFVLKWQLLWIAGWDPHAREYRASLVDNQGPNMTMLRGEIDGDRMVFHTFEDAPVRLRLSWDFSDAARWTWRNEMSPDGRTWTLVEEYEMSPSG
jgi:Protein of unknown function (DUF1579)